jgi:chromosome segregation ATPase
MNDDFKVQPNRISRILWGLGIGVIGLGLMVGCSGKSEESSAHGTGDVELVSASVSNAEEGATAPATQDHTESTTVAPLSESNTEAPVVPVVTQEEMDAVKTELEKARQAESELQTEIQALKEKISGLEKNLAAAQAETQKMETEVKSVQSEKDKLATENQRLMQLDYNEYARLVELSIHSPQEALSQWSVFIEKFPLSPLNREAQEQMKRVERRVKEDREIDRSFRGVAIYTNRAPIVRP